MKLRIGHVYQAAETVTAIINSNRILPDKGPYRVARLYAKLKPEYDLIVGRRNAMIEAYGHKEMVPDPAGVTVEGQPVAMVEAPNFSVPTDKMPEFIKAWAEFSAEEIEVNVEPMPLSQLCMAEGIVGGLTAAEFIVLDDLVAE